MPVWCQFGTLKAVPPVRTVEEECMSAELVAKLQLEYAKGLVVTIVGSGISVAATENQLVDEEAVATWSGLLRHGVRRCEELCLASPKEP